jgi:hypothetical protein
MNATEDFWSVVLSHEMLNSEANVEHRFVLPLLHALGYSSEDIESKYPVEFQQGRAGRKPEADFVCFYGILRDKTNSLLVVETKPFGEPLAQGKAQGESYAQNLRAPLLLLTNGKDLEIWQMQISLESLCVLHFTICAVCRRTERRLRKRRATGSAMQASRQRSGTTCEDSRRQSRGPERSKIFRDRQNIQTWTHVSWRARRDSNSRPPGS